ncbi:MAG TPA: ribonuclease P protein component [Spongiibacteraceae bacterium]|nr:ribonuclease P protein component [Spongiibacteraceae bacterium]
MAKLGFPKALRLLTPADFKQVFDAADLRVSNKELLILARVNLLDRPRLGLVIAKKHIRLATQRNRIKRVIRESFRAQQFALTSAHSIDTIVLARSGVDKLDNRTLHDLLRQLWQQLHRKAQKRQLSTPAG